MAYAMRRPRLPARQTVPSKARDARPPPSVCTSKRLLTRRPMKGDEALLAATPLGGAVAILLLGAEGAKQGKRREGGC
jgi:hypothetical protein